ncbi:ArsR/SmtB family transcription factor [Haloglomus irregulare]|jgi:predicted transcriptional regulator|nr:winged helix-turn-helix domain-containing protein [Haloglomus irregulare]
MSNATHHSPPEAWAGPDSEDERATVDSEQTLSMLGDDYAREILMAISTEALPAQEIADRLDLSRATVYRRLNRLESAGVVRATMSYHPDGHHRKQFQADFDRLVLSIETDGIGVDKST